MTVAITLKRQLTEEEKKIILGRHGRNCYASGHPIPESESLHYDHIKAFALDGPSELDNIAPMCEYHNKAKGMLPLEDFRIKLRIEDFFTKGDRLTLRDLFQYFKKEQDIETFGTPVTAEVAGEEIIINHHSFKKQYRLLQCPRTGWPYFYGELPVSVLNSDDDDDEHTGLQPRYLIFDKVFEMYRHFLVYPVLQPSIGRLVDERILLFDGQHKAAALMWGGRKTLECKIYVKPDVRILNQANISAHDKFAQTRFFSSILILKLGNQFGKDFDEYKDREDVEKKTEAGFLEFLEQKDPSLTRAERNKRFRSYLYKSILEDEINKLKPLVSTSNRSSDEQPLTVDMLSKSILACFLYTEPLYDDMFTEKYKREAEFKNVIALMNMLYELALNSWKPEASKNDQTHLKLSRIFSSKSIMAWSEILRDAVCAKLELHDSTERARPFYRDISEPEIMKIKDCLARLISWQMWNTPPKSQIDTQIAASKSTLKEWFKEKGLTTGFIMGAPE